MALIILISPVRVKANEFGTAEATQYSLRGLTATGSINTDDTRGTCASKREYFGKYMAIWLDTGDGQIHEDQFQGLYLVTDTGSKRIASGEVIDLYEPDPEKAKQFGRKKIIFMVLEV